MKSSLERRRDLVYLLICGNPDETFQVPAPICPQGDCPFELPGKLNIIDQVNSHEHSPIKDQQPMGARGQIATGQGRHPLPLAADIPHPGKLQTKKCGYMLGDGTGVGQISPTHIEPGRSTLVTSVSPEAKELPFPGQGIHPLADIPGRIEVTGTRAHPIIYENAPVHSNLALFKDLQVRADSGEDQTEVGRQRGDVLKMEPEPISAILCSFQFPPQAKFHALTNDLLPKEGGAGRMGSVGEDLIGTSTRVTLIFR